MGAQIITGLIGNPLDNITQQLNLKTSAIVNEGTLRTLEGEIVDNDLDDNISVLFNKILDSASSLRQTTAKNDVSLGDSMQRLVPPLPSVQAGVWIFFAFRASLLLLAEFFVLASFFPCLLSFLSRIVGLVLG
jgi:hypothetical protein